MAERLAEEMRRFAGGEARAKFGGGRGLVRRGRDTMKQEEAREDQQAMDRRQNHAADLAERNRRSGGWSVRYRSASMMKSLLFILERFSDPADHERSLQR
eukprot:763944-Hanusia_phi.AAC.1